MYYKEEMHSYFAEEAGTQYCLFVYVIIDIKIY